MKFSLEIGPKTDIETVPALSDVYITMLPGGDYKETATKADFGFSVQWSTKMSPLNAPKSAREG